MNTALNEIFDEAERNEEYLTCKEIKKLLNEQFNLFISLKNLYCELQRVSNFRCPSTVPKLTENNKQLRVDHCIIVNQSNIDNWIFTDESSIQLFRKKRKTWIRRGRRQRLTQSNNFRESVMILGGVSKLGKTTLWISEKGQRINQFFIAA